MIFFGDPGTRGAKEDAAACVMMAIEMRSRIKYLSNQWESEGIFKPLQIRFGINTGYCTVGNFGSENRLEYTIVGGNVNIANRLESRAKGNEILISNETYALVKDKIFCKKQKALAIKGVANPVQNYLVIDAYQNIKLPHLDIRDEKNGLELSINLQRGNEDWIIETLRSVISKIELTGNPLGEDEEN
jgi:class 3 adenylate cyclase